MNRLSIYLLIGCAGLLTSCSNGVSSSTQPGTNDVYSMVVVPVQFTLDAGDFSSITATVDLSNQNVTPKPITPQPPIEYSSSDARVTVSPAGAVCAGLWDSRYVTCTPALIPATDPTTGLPNPNAGQPNLPTGYVIITAFNASHNVTGTSQLAVHSRAASITLSASATSPNPAWQGSTQPWPNNVAGTAPLSCVSQFGQVQYVAHPLNASLQPIPSCSVAVTPGCVNNNDYTWTTDNSTVAQVSNYGFVIARNPGVTNVYATLNGTVSAPLAFVTCPPSSIILSTSPYTGGTPLPPYSTADLTGLNKGSQEYVTASLLDTNGNPLVISPLTDVTENPLTGSFTPFPPLTAKLSANTSGRFLFLAGCSPAQCNPAVEDFTSPAGPSTGAATGFGYPIYSNVIGATVQGSTGSAVLVTGTTLADGVTPAHRLLVYDSESLALIQTVVLANLPNSLVISPNGATAYVGSSGGLMVVNLTTYQSALQTYPVAGGQTNPPELVTGAVLGVSPDSRYVLVSDVPDGYVFLIDTTGTKEAVRYTIPNITSVTFAPDDSNFWIGGASGVFVFQADTFVPTMTNISTNVTSLAWTPDGQSYFASGSHMVNYSTCNDQNPQTAPSDLTSSVIEGLSTNSLNGVPHVLGLDGTEWFDYSVTSSSQVPIQTGVSPLSALVPGGTGNVCKSTVTVNAPATAASTLLCTAQQISFSPTREEEFVTGVNSSCATSESVIHAYTVGSTTESTLTTTNPVVPLSGGVLNDGRKLYFGTSDGTNGVLLHRVDLATGTEDFVQQEVLDPATGLPTTNPPTFVTTVPATVSVTPSFVAVVPK